ncbi:kinase-like domain-containing protein [Melampsora americana]|nr:kinase-like domain-containing protein [Melampsora americana]
MPRYYSDDYLPNPPLTTITEEDTPPPSPSAELDDHLASILSDYSDDALPNPPLVLPDYSDEDSPSPTLPLITKQDHPSIVYSDYSDKDSPNPPLALITTNHTPPSKSSAELNTLSSKSITSEERFEFPPEVKDLKKIGRGAFGSVFKAKYKGFVRAIKVIRRFDKKGNDRTASIQNEVNILYDLEHPFITQSFHHWYNSQNLYIVLEFASQGSLDRLIDRTNISMKETRRIILDLGSALDYIHNKKIIHRDIKSENILLTSNHQIKLADFGLAKRTSDGFTSGNCGTRHIKAPEILNRQLYSKAVDWWALGILFSEMIKIDHPFDSDNRDDKTLEYNILHSDPYMPLSVSYLCDEVLVRILDKDVTSRVKSLNDLNSLQFFQCDDPY